MAHVVGAVVRSQVLGEVRPLPHALPRAPGVKQALGARHGGLPVQGVERAPVVEAAHAHGVEGRQRGGGRVAGHHVGGPVDVHPAVPHPVVLLGVVEQRLREVPGHHRFQQRQQLDLRPVLVPAGEVAVLRVLPGFQPVRLLVHARVLAVHVTDQVRLLEAVVQRGVEHGAGAADPHSAQFGVPGALGRGGHLVDRSVRLGAQVAFGAFERHVGDRQPHADPAARGEAHVAAGATPRAVPAGGVALAAGLVGATGLQGVVPPGAGAGDRLVELRHEVQPVVALAVVDPAVRAPPAEGPGQHRTGDPPVCRVQVGLRVRTAVEGVGGPEQQGRRPVGGEAERAGGRALGGGEVGAHPVGQREPVAARGGRLGGVREVAGVPRVGAVGTG